MISEFEDLARGHIDTVYRRDIHTGGWRMFYSPPDTLLKSDVVFIGMNPGGGDEDADTEPRIFTLPGQSSYVHEVWARSTPPGESRLQKQVRAFFKHIGTDPWDALCGNIVPFRSRDWHRLALRNAAIRAGQAVWREAYKIRPRKLTLCMGRDTKDALVSGVLTRPVHIKDVDLKWGAKRKIQGSLWTYESGLLIHMPHLSRYSVFDRAASENAVNELMDTVKSYL